MCLLNLLTFSFIVAFATIAKSTPSMPEPYFVGSTEANITDFPYHISLRFVHKPTCGAAIISKTWAITTGSCIYSFAPNPEFYSVKVGSTHEVEGGVVHQVSTYFLHPRYNTSIGDNDVALIKVTTPFLFSNTTQPVPLADANTNISTNSMGLVTGWGYTSNTGPSYATKLRKLPLPIIDQTKCNKTYNGLVTNSMFCAGYTDRTVDVCGGRGSPMVANGKLIGLVSWGYGCANRRYPTIFTRLPALRKWISSVIGF